MRRALILLMMVALVACGGKKKSATETKSYAEGTPQAAFVAMHKNFRAADGQASWALFSNEMKAGMALRIKSLREQPKRLQADLGSVPSDLDSISDSEFYQLLLSGKRMQKKLARGFPVIVKAAELEPGIHEIHYTDPRRGACKQRFIKEDGGWKAQRGPACPASKK